MPGDDGLWFDNHKRLPPGRPQSGEQHQGNRSARRSNGRGDFLFIVVS